MTKPETRVDLPAGSVYFFLFDVFGLSPFCDVVSLATAAVADPDPSVFVSFSASNQTESTLEVYIIEGKSYL